VVLKGVDVVQVLEDMAELINVDLEVLSATDLNDEVVVVDEIVP